MWLLECDGELFEQKRKWLRPGTKHILGRTSKPEAGLHVRFIDNGSVSRQHLKIEIEDVKPQDSAHLHSKSKLTITDNSKIGTLLNGEKVHKASRVLDKNDNEIKLGNYEAVFRIKWHAIVFSSPSISRAQRQLADPLAELRKRLEPLDIKCVVDFVTQSTSHVISKKRNTNYVLQGLVNARHIVTDAYVAELQKVDIAALTEDFDANWPSTLDFSPPPGNEPNPRPDKSPDFLPNPERSEIFTNHTFIFCDAQQYQTLMPVVNGGGGKALLHALDPTKPDIDDFLQYVREVAGKKGRKSFDLGQQPKSKGGIIVVANTGGRVNFPDFYNVLDSSLGQSSIEQNEFLEAILDVDALKLKRLVEVRHASEDPEPVQGKSFLKQHLARSPPQRHSTRQASQTLSRATESIELRTDVPTATPDDPAPDPSQRAPSTSKRRGRRPITQTKFRGFDEIDVSQLPKYRSPSPSQPPDDEPSQARSADVMDEDANESQSQAFATQPSQRTSRKRPVEDVESHQDVMAGMLQGAATMKRRRLEEEREGNKTLDPVEEEPPAPPSTTKKPKRRKDKEIDVMAIVNERRKAEEEARLQDEENLRNALEGMDVSEIRNLAQVEEMDVIRKDAPPRSRYDAEAGHDDRWDDRWNGRRNFKKFRRQGNAGYTQNRPRVFVQLEEAVPKSFNGREDYFLERSDKQGRRAEKRSSQHHGGNDAQQSGESFSTALPTPRSQTQQPSRNTNTSISLASDPSSDEESTSRFRRRIRESRLEDAEASRMAELAPEEIAGTARDADIAAAARQSKSSAAARTRPGKRTAAGVADERPAQKRQARIRAPSPDEESEDDDDDDDDDDEESALKFRRRKR